MVGGSRLWGQEPFLGTEDQAQFLDLNRCWAPGALKPWAEWSFRPLEHLGISLGVKVPVEMWVQGVFLEPSGRGCRFSD